MVRYQAFLWQPQSDLWVSVTGPVNSPDVAVDLLLLHLRWVELYLRGAADRLETTYRSLADAPALFAIVRQVTPGNEATTFLREVPSPDIVQHLRLTKDTTHRDWRWAIEDVESP